MLNYMKSRACILICILLLLSFSSMAQKQPATPKELSDRIDDISDSLTKLGKAWGNKLNTVVYSKSFDSLVSLRIKMQDYITSSLAELSALPDIKGSKKFVASMIAFLDFELNMMKDAFLPMEKLDRNSSQSDINKAFGKLVEIGEKENDELEKVYDEQVEYSKKNKFKIRDE
jgi:hypothetical protein